MTLIASVNFIEMKKILSVPLILALVFLAQCSHYDELKKHGLESAYGSDESHNFGQNCMSCHNDPHNEASGEYRWWNIAGSVEGVGEGDDSGGGDDDDDDNGGSTGSARIELWSQKNRQGQLYYTLPVDDEGNFYTAKIVQYYGVCYPVVVNNETGDWESMGQAFTGGGCNSCHGVTESMISIP